MGVQDGTSTFLGIPYIVIIQAGGYVYLYFCNYTKYSLKYDSVSNVFFKSALIGFVLWVLAGVSTAAAYKMVNEAMPDRVLIVPILGVVYGYIFSMILNVFYSKRDAAKSRGNSLYVLVCDAINANQSSHGNQLIELTMKGGRTYVGRPKPIELGDEYVDLISDGAKSLGNLNNKISLKVEEIEAVKLCSQLQIQR